MIILLSRLQRAVTYSNLVSEDCVIGYGCRHSTSPSVSNSTLLHPDDDLINDRVTILTASMHIARVMQGLVRPTQIDEMRDMKCMIGCSL